MGHTHFTSSGDIGASKSFLIYNCDETNIIGEDVDII